MGIKGDTRVHCIQNIVNYQGEIVLATKDGQIYRYNKEKQTFELISNTTLHDGSTIKEVDELCVLIS